MFSVIDAGFRFRHILQRSSTLARSPVAGKGGVAASKPRRFAHFVAGLVYIVLVIGPLACEEQLREPTGQRNGQRVERGQVLYAENCATCHGGATGGSLKQIPPPHNANGHTWHHPDQQLTDMVLNGIFFSLEEQNMPAFKDRLSEADIEAILAYIKNWWTPEQREFQATVTAQWGE